MKASLILVALLALGTAQKAQDKQMGWWKHAVIYQIYPKSFQSSTGNGTGDLKGILNRFEYIKYLGVDAIWINPIYPSKTNADAGYDISDFKAIDPNFGTMDDLKTLIHTCHNQSIKVILDFVPNHSSSGHDWFQWSIARQGEYEDYYVWMDPKPGNKTPNNWISGMENGPAWAYNENRKQFYFHQFLRQQPDLNYDNPKVRKEMQDVLRFWLELGVDGFRMDAVNTIWEDRAFKDEPVKPDCDPTKDDCLDHIYTSDQPETFNILAEFRQVLDEYTKNHDGYERIMFTESYSEDLSLLLKYYGTAERPIDHFPFNFILLQEMKVNHVGLDWANWINKWFQGIPMERCWPNWVMGNHDQPRMTTRFTPEHTDLIHMSLMTLPGTYIIYAGDELALENSFVRPEQGVDPQGTEAPKDQFYNKTRDPQRGPIPWDSSDNGGFSLKKPWLPLTADKTVTVQAERDAPKSHLKLFKSLVAMRKLETYKRGDFKVGTLNETTPEVLVITRSLIDNPTVITLANFGIYRVTVDIQKYRPTLPDEMYVYASSNNAPVQPKQKLKNPIVLEPISGMVLSTAILQD